MRSAALLAGRTALDARADRAVRRAVVLALAAGIGALAAMTAATDAGRIRQSLYGWPWDEAAVEAPKPALYYAARAAALAALGAAGALGLAASRGALPRRHLAWFAALQLAGVLMALHGLALEDLLTTRIALAAGPIAAAVSIAIYASAGRARMRAAGRALDVLAWALAAVVLVRAATLRSIVREEAVAALGAWADALFFPAAWHVLRPREGAAARLRWVPALAYGAAAILTQTRLDLALLALLAVADLYAAARRRGAALGRVAIAAGTAALALAAGAPLLDGTPLARTFDAALAGLGARLGEDSRSHQLASFAADVAPWELLLGRGAGATWRWPGMSLRWAGGTDVGYLSLLFFGGLPLLAGWWAVHVVPAWRALRGPDPGTPLACALVVLLYAARMLSSSFPALSLEYVTVLLCVGGCLAHAPRGAARAHPR